MYEPAQRKLKLINRNGSEIQTGNPHFEAVDFMG